MTPEQQLQDLEKRLSSLYITISDSYKRMSKIKDAFRLDAAQAGIDQILKQTIVVRNKITDLQKEIADTWENSGEGNLQS